MCFNKYLLICVFSLAILVNIAAFSGEIKLHITLHLVQVTCAETYVDALEFSNAVLQLFHLGRDLA